MPRRITTRHAMMMVVWLDHAASVLVLGSAIHVFPAVLDLTSLGLGIGLGGVVASLIWRLHNFVHRLPPHDGQTPQSA